MRRRGPPPNPVRRALALAAACAILGGCAEMHSGVEAVGRIGGSPAPVAEVGSDGGTSRPVKVVRLPSGSRPSPAEAASTDAPAPVVLATAVPSPRQIFDFHPAGSRPDAWRQPFVIDTADGPLAADVRRSSAELRAFLADQKAGRDKTTGATAGRRRCGEDAVATGKPGCPVTATHAAATRVDGPAAQ